MTKAILRKIMLKRLKLQKEVARLKKSDKIKAKVFALKEFKKAKTIFLYASFNGEVQTHKMIKEVLKKGKRVCLPFVVKKKKRLIPRAIKDLKGSLEPGPYTILQPRKDCSWVVARKDLDFVIVPGLAFDHQGFRLGRGGGYYDRFLLHLPKKVHTIGVCFDFQLASSVPHSSFDLPVQKVISA